MTNNEILKADLLDILFEHRNKSYGAYTLRRYYNNRLLIALGIALSAVLLFFLISLLKGGNQADSVWNDNKNIVTISEIEIDKPKEEVKPKEIEKPKPVAQKDFQTIQIEKDDKVKNPIVEQNDLIDVAISDKDVEGDKPVDPSKSVSNETSNEGTGKQEEKQSENIIDIFEVQPSFPGGPEALALFFSRMLNSPTNLEPGEKKVVLVRFIVGADGSITKAEVVQSGGDSYDREVLRAFKRMPKWNPAIQNGIKVSASFTQPVTFIGVEP